MSERKSEELKPCPFCANDNHILMCDSYYHWVSCTKCGCEGPLSESEGAAIEKLNRRPTNEK